MTEFETVQSKVKDFGGAGFIGVERKRVKEAGDSGNGNEFLLIVRGFYLKDGTAKRRNYVTIPDTPEVKEFIAKSLKEV